ncbi:MAG: hypothetical protein VYD19_07450 [Myxococcota bacterium]|nr:hypothetical protein [Myxococcota bacterium]
MSSTSAQRLRFEFRYTIFSQRAELSERQLIVKSSTRTTIVPLAGIELLWLGISEGNEQQELLIAYRDLKRRLKRARVYADLEEPGFAALIDALIRRQPEIDQRALSREDAYARSGAQALSWLALPTLMGLGILTLAVGLSPLLRHGLDRGERTLSLQTLIDAPKGESRNLKLSSFEPLDPYQIREVSAQGGDAELIRLWIPVRPKGAPLALESQVILSLKGYDDASIQAQLQSEHVDGVLRDIWWEGLSAGRRQQLTDQGLRITVPALLVEVGAKPRHDLTLFFLLIGALSLLTGAVWSYLRPASEMVKRQEKRRLK